MFTSTLKPIAQYREVGTITAVSQADPHQLVLLLFDAAVAAVLQARHALATGDTPTRHATISKAMRIIDEGLKASVASDADPDLADKLCGLYEHMVARLFAANVHGSDEALAEVLRLLGELRSAWAEIAAPAVARADLRA